MGGQVASSVRRQVEPGQPQPRQPGAGGVGRQQLGRGRRRPATRCVGGGADDSARCPGRPGGRGSTTQKPPGCSVDRCSRTGSPSGPRASSAAGTTAEVLTTSRSPGSRTSARSAKRWCDDWPSDRGPPSAARRPGRRSRARPPSPAARRACPPRRPRGCGRAAGRVTMAWRTGATGSAPLRILARATPSPVADAGRVHHLHRTASSASADRPRPGTGRSAGAARSAAPGRAPGSRAAGRSEMSSPGKASWCICVRMSPGSTQ